MDKISAELRNAYEKTNYKVFLNDKEICFTVGEQSTAMNNLLEHFGFDNFVFITAANPNSSLKQDNENKHRNLKLEKMFTNKKIKYYKGIGESADGKWAEESFCAFNLNLQIAKAIAKKFEQNAFVYGMKNKVPEIVYCI